MIKSSDIPAPATTGIGSLPHRDGASALDGSFAVDIPYFPTLPGLDPQQGMLIQGLAGVPGISLAKGGVLSFDRAAFRAGREAFAEKLQLVCGSGPRIIFPAGAGGLWDRFVERAAADSRPWVKTQWLGPVTAVLALEDLTPGSFTQAEDVTLLGDWLAAQAAAMAGELTRHGKQVLFFWDEPGLGSTRAREGAGARAAKYLLDGIGALKNSDLKVGIHCCGKWDLAEVLSWPLDVISFDAGLSGDDLLAAPEGLRAFRKQGGRLALGLVPTQLASTWNSRQEVEQWRTRFFTALGEAAAQDLLAESLLTPACGLGSRTMAEAEAVFTALDEVKKYL